MSDPEAGAANTNPVTQEQTESTRDIPRRPLIPFKVGSIPHVLVMICLALVCAMVAFTWIAPISLSPKTSTGMIVDQAWMLEVRRGRENPEAVETDKYDRRNEPWYGISPLKVCRWTFNGTDMVGEAKCTGVGWMIPGRMGDLEELEDLGLSMAIRQVFPVILPTIILIPIYTFYQLFFAYLTAYRKPPSDGYLVHQYPRNKTTHEEQPPQNVLARIPDGKAINIMRYNRLRMPGGDRIWVVASVGALYITLWGTLIAALKQKGEGDLEVRYGKGFIIFLTSTILHAVFVGLVPWLLGLKVVKSGSSQSGKKSSSCFRPYK